MTGYDVILHGNKQEVTVSYFKVVSYYIHCEGGKYSALCTNSVVY